MRLEKGANVEMCRHKIQPAKAIMGHPVAIFWSFEENGNFAVEAQHHRVEIGELSAKLRTTTRNSPN